MRRVAPAPAADGRSSRSLVATGWVVLIAVFAALFVRSQFDSERPPTEVTYEVSIGDLAAFSAAAPLRRGEYTASLTCRIARASDPCPPMPFESIDIRASGAHVSGTLEDVDERLWRYDDSCTPDRAGSPWRGSEMLRGLVVERDGTVDLTMAATLSPRFAEVRSRMPVCERFAVTVFREHLLPINSPTGIWLWYSGRD